MIVGAFPVKPFCEITVVTKHLIAVWEISSTHNAVNLCIASNEFTVSVPAAIDVIKCQKLYFLFSATSAFSAIMLQYVFA